MREFLFPIQSYIGSIYLEAGYHAAGNPNMPIPVALSPIEILVNKGDN